MRQQTLIIGGVVAALVLILLVNSLYIMRVDQQGIVLQFGQARDDINRNGDQAGLHFKIPFVQNIQRYDRRNLGFDLQAQEVTTGSDDSDQQNCANTSAPNPAIVPTPTPTGTPSPGDTSTPDPAATPSPAPTTAFGRPLVIAGQACGLQRLVVDAYVRYRISDPLQFFRAAVTVTNGQDQLRQRLIAAMRDEIGNVKASEIISSKRTEVMKNIRIRLTEPMRNLGVEVIDVRIRRADLPRENSERVYEQMKTVFDAQAKGISALGDAEKLNTQAEGDRRARVTEAEANSYASQTKGDGDKKRAEIYAKAYGQDPEFYAFYRSMEAYKKAIKEGTPIVLSPDSEFFRYFKDAQGR